MCERLIRSDHVGVYRASSEFYDQNVTNVQNLAANEVTGALFLRWTTKDIPVQSSRPQLLVELRPNLMFFGKTPRKVVVAVQLCKKVSRLSWKFAINAKKTPAISVNHSLVTEVT